MKYFFLLLLVSVNVGLFAQKAKKEVVCVAFYNLENLFDTEESKDVVNVEKYKSGEPDYVSTTSKDVYYEGISRTLADQNILTQLMFNKRTGDVKLFPKVPTKDLRFRKADKDFFFYEFDMEVTKAEAKILIAEQDFLFSKKEFKNLVKEEDTVMYQGSGLSNSIGDKENTAEGLRQYSEEVYNDKLSQLSSVISVMGTDYTPDGPAILGIGEIENEQVLLDLAKTDALAKRNYQVIQYNSQYRRGIDVGFMYQPKYFTPTHSEVIVLEDMYYGKKPSSRVITRDILMVEGELLGEPITIFVNHWPSRRAESRLREEAAAALMAKIDAMIAEDPKAKIFIMGDLNDDPISPSVKKVVGAKKKSENLKDGEFFNPLWKDYKKGYGTLSYRGSWNLFDQIIVSSGLVNNTTSLTFHKAEAYYDQEMMNQFGGYKGGPNRSYGGNHYQPSGFSDHLPTLMYLTRDAKADEDKDGIADEDDDCPKVPGIKAFNGCPDTDGDGVPDADDECIETPGDKDLYGCPDGDGDGVADINDDCPEKPGLLVNRGCPEDDQDKDGVADKVDKCPETPGLKSNDGCPEIKDEVKEVLQLAFDNLEFETAKSIIKTSSDDELENLAKILVENKSMQLNISGHTDNVGNDESNMILSKDRAQAVKTRLKSLGVAESRMNAFWFGETQPIATNETAEGRQRNRRVTFEIFYK